MKVHFPENDEVSYIVGRKSSFHIANLLLWEFLVGISTKRSLYDRVRIPFGVYFFGQPLPDHETFTKILKTVKERGMEIPPVGVLFFPPLIETLEGKGDDEMKFSWRKVEENFGKILGLRRRWGSGRVTGALDLFNDYWEVELKTRAVMENTHRVFTIAAENFYDMILRGMTRHKCPLLLLVVYPPNEKERYVIFIPMISSLSRKIFKVLSIDPDEIKTIGLNGRFFNIYYHEGKGIFFGRKMPLPLIVVSKDLDVLVAEVNIPTLQELLKVNPLGG